MKSPTILLIDDEKDIRDLLESAVLESYPEAKIAHSSDGSEALQKIMRQRFDLVITDLQMPKSDGISLMRTIHKVHDDFKPGAILILSGHIEADLHTKIQTYVTYMSKPFSFKAIDDYLKRTFENPNSMSKMRPDVAFINTFIDTSLALLAAKGDVKPNKEGVALKPISQASGDISATILLKTDKCLASLGIAFDEGFFLYLASKISGKQFKEVDSEAASIAIELCSEMASVLVNQLNNQGFSLTPPEPHLNFSKGHAITHLAYGPCVSIQFKTPQGNFRFEGVIQPFEEPPKT